MPVLLTYAMNNRGNESLYAYLYRCIRSDIEMGVIAPDEKLPSKRALAKHLGVSLVTVEGAYTQLVAEGWARSVPRSGFFANKVERPARVATSAGGSDAARVSSNVGELGAVRVSSNAGGADATLVSNVADGADKPDGASESSSAADSHLPPNASSSSIAADLFPFAAWSRTVREVLAHEPEAELLRESPHTGTLRLRRALAAHVRAFRGLEVLPDQILLGSGAQTLYGLIIQLVGRMSHFAVEDPGYPRLTKIYQNNDVQLSHIPLDGAGISISALAASSANVVHLMPSHQFPTGQVTPVNRRYELLGWASEVSGRYIIEDDYDCEFRLMGRPIPAMKSIDATDCVIYTNTFSRSLGPAFRVAYAILPQHLMERFKQDLNFYSCTVSTMEQLALARFIEEGHFERHINRMRTRLRVLRAYLVEAFHASRIATRVDMEGSDAGLHFLLHIRTHASEIAIADAACRAGMDIMPLSAFRLGKNGASDLRRTNISNRSGDRSDADGKNDLPTRTFVVSYSGLDEAHIDAAVRALECVADKA